MSPSRSSLHSVPETSSVYVISPEELEDPLVVQGTEYWNSLRGDRRFPARDDLTPRGMAGFLRNVVLVKVIGEGEDYEYRIAGDAHVEAHGAPFKGIRLSQIEAIHPTYGRLTRATYEHVRTTAAPYALRGWVGKDFPKSRFVYYESIFLPLGPGDDDVDHLLVVGVYAPRMNA